MDEPSSSISVAFQLRIFSSLAGTRDITSSLPIWLLSREPMKAISPLVDWVDLLFSGFTGWPKVYPFIHTRNLSDRSEPNLLGETMFTKILSEFIANADFDDLPESAMSSRQARGSGLSRRNCRWGKRNHCGYSQTICRRDGGSQRLYSYKRR